MNPVAEAIQNTPIDYMNSILEMRNPGPNAIGSMFEKTQSKESLMGFDWKPYEHQDIVSPAVGYSAEIPGFFGLVTINMAAFWDLPLYLVPSRKGTGFMEVVTRVSRESSLIHSHLYRTFSVALLGPGDSGKTILWTVFPGEPIQPSTMPVDGGPRLISPREAEGLGFSWAKIDQSRSTWEEAWKDF